MNLTATNHVPHVLVVEDEAKTRQSLAEGLRLEGWTVSTAENGREAAQLIQGESFALMVMDWMLPDRSGMELIREARGQGVVTPILMLTARDAVEDRVSGLEGGADDYMVKPFALPELVARSRALLRRSLQNPGHILSCADLRLDTRRRVAERAGTEIPLTPREVDILEYLLRHQNRVVTREMLQHDVWKEMKRFTSLDNVIDVQIMRLRKKIDEHGQGAAKLIHTVRGLGYRLGKE